MAPTRMTRTSERARDIDGGPVPTLPSIRRPSQAWRRGRARGAAMSKTQGDAADGVFRIISFEIARIDIDPGALGDVEVGPRRREVDGGGDQQLLGRGPRRVALPRRGAACQGEDKEAEDGRRAHRGLAGGGAGGSAAPAQRSTAARVSPGC